MFDERGQMVQRTALCGARFQCGVEFMIMNVTYVERSAKKTLCKNIDFRYENLLDDTTDGISVKTKREKTVSVRGARHATGVLPLWQWFK